MTPFLTPLDALQRTAVGVPDDWHFAWSDRVRFYEIDALDHVNNTVYLRWFETIRVEYLRSYGVTTYDGTDVQVVLKALTASFHKPMLRMESYAVAARTRSYRNTSFTMEYSVFAPDLRAEGTALVVLLDAEGRKAPIPEAAKAAFRERDGALAD